MDNESIRSYCLSLPHVTEDIQWECDLLFRVGKKMFAVIVLDTKYPHRFSFKCSPEKFAELIEMDGIIPAPYSARYHWVALLSLDIFSDSELKKLIKDSYDLVFAKLPKKLKAELSQSG